MTYVYRNAVGEGLRVAIRQATATALETLSSVTAGPSPSAVSSPLSTAIILTSAAASPTDSSTVASGGGNSASEGGSGAGDSGGTSNSSSSLLFFVALGFGVVFTNLWIIVGVKYCFRYNARNRQLRNEDGDPINMENMPRPRRRREKKLMSIDEVNEKFPMLKYKAWVASRAQEGLPTRGGVSAPPSRPSSIRDADGVAPEVPPKEESSTGERPTTSATGTAAAAAAALPTTETEKIEEKGEAQNQNQAPRHAPKESTSSTVVMAPRPSADVDREQETAVAQKHMSQASHEEDDDEHIDAALPPECVGTSGDTCAICIDTLEDDDDVRGLTCGHAFHAVCIDPWLTTRRACCPLCKADYYIPKPRPQAAEGGDGGDGTTGVITVTLPRDTGSSGNRRNVQSRPRNGFLSFARPEQRSTSQYASGRRRTTGGSRPAGDWELGYFARLRERSNRESPPASTARSGGQTAGAGSPFSGLRFSGLRAALPTLRLGRGRNNQDQSGSGPVASGANTAVTPSQLEAGMIRPA